MNKRLSIWFGLTCALPILLAACGGTAASEPEPKAVTTAAIGPPATEEPTPTGPRTGDLAPDFTLPDGDGIEVTLSDELQANRLVVLVFYHAFG